jgi:hypothetical protein
MVLSCGDNNEYAAYCYSRYFSWVLELLMLAR